MTKSLSLIELLLAISLIVLIVFGLANIDIFGRHNVLTADKKAQIQNEVAHILEHMAKEIGTAIGDVTTVPVVIDDFDATGTGRRVKFYKDVASGGGPGDGRISASDYWAAYRFRDSSAPAQDRYQLWYCPNCSDGSACDDCAPDWGTSVINTLSKKITAFSPSYNSANNYLEVRITACWEPSGIPYVCASRDNPQITMLTSFKIPSASTH